MSDGVARDTDRVFDQPAPAANALDLAEQQLVAAGIPSARVDAELLLAHVLGESRGRIRAMALAGSALPDIAAEDRYRALVARRAGREPLQHLTGRAGFRGLELAVGPGVFVPRPETEVVAGLAVQALAAVDANDHRPVAVDLGTGSGAIALALAAEVPEASVVAVEVMPEAFAWARRNAAELGLPNVRVVCADLASALPDATHAVDVVVSNPPYIPDDAVPIDPEVRLHDPVTALYGGADGLDPMRAVVAAAARLLRARGLLVVEHGEHQGSAVRDLLARPAWTDVRTHPDLTGRDRCTLARRAS